MTTPLLFAADLGLVAPALAFVAASLLVWVLAGIWREPIARFLAAKREVYREELLDIFASAWTPATLVNLKYFGAPAALVLVFFFTGKIVFAILVGVGLHLLPDFLLTKLRQDRTERLRMQVVEVISAISTTTRAGLTLNESLEEASAKLEAPAGQELTMLCERVRSGQSIDAALTATDERINLPGYSLLVKALIVNRERGGRLSSLLETMAETLRELYKLEEKVRSQTSGIRLAARVMVLMPLILGLILYSMDPGMVSLLWTSLWGQLILAVIIILDLVGFLMLKRLAEPDI